MVNPDDEVAAALALLNAALDDPAIDFGVEFAGLAHSARRAVASYLGLSITATVDGVPTALSIPPAPWPVPPRTSLRVVPPPPEPPPTPTTDTASPAAPVAVILYAAAPGAFIDLAADMAYQQAIPLTDIALDQHLPDNAHPSSPPTGATTGATTITDLSTINQAVGVLIDQGQQPHHARDTLHRNATAAGTTLSAAAAATITAAQH